MRELSGYRKFHGIHDENQFGKLLARLFLLNLWRWFWSMWPTRYSWCCWIFSVSVGNGGRDGFFRAVRVGRLTYQCFKTQINLTLGLKTNKFHAMLDHFAVFPSQSGLRAVLESHESHLENSARWF